MEKLWIVLLDLTKTIYHLKKEQEEVLLPLSIQRAEAIKDALIRRRIEENRIITVGYRGFKLVDTYKA